MVLEPIVLRSGALSPEDQKVNKPGGPANKAVGATGWLRYLIVLQRAHAVQVAQRGGSAPVQNAEAEQNVLDALRAAPEVVELSDGGSMAVYPKSYHAMLELHKLDLKLGFLNAIVQAARDALPTQQADALDVLTRGIEAVSYHLGLLAWASTTEGPGLPWSESDANPVLPDPIKALTSIDLYLLANAYQRVNNARLAAVEGLLTAKPKTEGKPVRPSWAVFFSTAAKELGVRPETLLREWSLGAVMSSMRLARDAEEAAMEPGAREGRMAQGTREVL